MTKRSSSQTARLLSYLRQPINTGSHLLEAELIVLAFAIGIQDAGSFPRFHCFVSNQTGNTVLFAISALSLYGDRAATNYMVAILNVLFALLFFLAGVFVAGQIANRLNCKTTRWWLLTSNFFSSVMALGASIILFCRPEIHRNTAPMVTTISLLAFASGSQVAMTRQLSMPEIPTAQATAAYVDLFIDPNFFAGLTQNRGRNRRVAFLVSLFTGSFAGAGIYKHLGVPHTFLISALIKWVIFFGFFINPADSTHEDKAPICIESGTCVKTEHVSPLESAEEKRFSSNSSDESSPETSRETSRKPSKENLKELAKESA